MSQVAINMQNDFYPLPNTGTPTQTAGNFTQTYEGSTGFTKFNLFDARLDYNPTVRDAVFGRVSWRSMYLDGTDLPATIGTFIVFFASRKC